MPASHRNGDSRACGAATIVSGQSTVFVNSQLWSVAGDPNSHGGGPLSNGLAPTVFIGGIGVIVVGDSAGPDALCIPLGGPHCAPNAASGSGDVYAGA